MSNDTALTSLVDGAGKYRTLYIDPPWPERGGGKIKRGADRHYGIMSVKEIMALPVSTLAHPDGCHLYLWATNNYLRAALDCLDVWGFEYVTAITWGKDKMGLGQYYRGMTEHCIFAITKQRLPYKVLYGKRQQGTTLLLAPRTIHSKKPAEMRGMIEKVSYAPRLEMFARERFEGWDAWGNEVPK